MEHEDELRAVGEALADAENDPRTPLCVRRAFASDAVLVGALSIGPVTMLGWMRLEHAESPYLSGELPGGAPERMAALGAALGALDGGPAVAVLEVLSPEQALEAEAVLTSRIEEAFSTVLRMRRPARPGARPDPEGGGDDGFGWWPRMLVMLVRELGMGLAEALRTPVCQVFALAATARSLDGWRPAEANYKEREALAGS